MPAAASKFVDEFNSKFEETTKAKDAFADSVAKMETDFDEKMGEIEQTMVGTVEKMEMTDEAAAAAKATIEAYCNAIRSMTGEAGSAAQAVANAAAAHLSTTPSTTVSGHANGTVSAPEDVYIAGEEGPELIIGARGSEVFPAQETERILSAVGGDETPISTENSAAFRSGNQPTPSEESGGDRSEKRIILEINGSGSIDATGADEDTILDVLTRHVKPVLMNIIKGEIFEEGDLAYDF